MEKDGFDVHHSSRHSVQDPLPDQVKGAWFCVQKAYFFFRKNERKEIECYSLDGKGDTTGKVPKNLINMVQKGKQKIRDGFQAKLYCSFPDLRHKILMG